MKKALVFSMFFLIVFTVASGNYGMSYKAKSGDSELDLTLGNINTEAQADIQRFMSDLSSQYNVPKCDIEDMINLDGFEPADAFMAVKVSNLSGKPLEDVANEYKNNKAKGWGVIAQKMGIKPGSEEFHALKNEGNCMLNKIKHKNKHKHKTESKIQGKGKND